MCHGTQFITVFSFTHLRAFVMPVQELRCINHQEESIQNTSLHLSLRIHVDS